MPLFFHLLTNYHYPKSNHYPINQNLLAEALKNNFSPFCVFFFQLTRSSLHQKTEEFLAFIKATVHALAISITCVLFNVNWLIFKGEQI